MKTRKIGLANYLAYGSGDFLGAGTTALTAAWLLYFYTTFCGLHRLKQRSSLRLQGYWMLLLAR
jgi:Na+/melibiose symporter-like transporter